MKKLACADIDPSFDCDFVAEGKTDKEVIGKMMAHAKSAHPDKLASMSDADQKAMMQKMNDLLAGQ